MQLLLLVWLVASGFVAAAAGVYAFFAAWIWLTGRWGAVGIALGWCPALLVFVLIAALAGALWLPALVLAALRKLLIGGRRASLRQDLLDVHYRVVGESRWRASERQMRAWRRRSRR